MSRVIQSALSASDGYSERDREGWGGIRLLCHSCQRYVTEKLEDGWCWQCNHPGEPPISEQEHQRVAAELKHEAVRMLWRKAHEHAQMAEQEIRENYRLYHMTLVKAYKEEAHKREQELKEGL